MDSGSSAAGGLGPRVAPSERAPLPPLVGERGAEAFAERGVTVDPAARVAQTAQLLPGTTVGARTVVADMCVVGPNALVSEGARLDAWCVVGDRAVIGPGADIGSATSIDADCTVGRDAVLGSAVQVAPGVAIREGLRVEGPQAVWADHPAAVSADPCALPARDVRIGAPAPPHAVAPGPAAGASAAEAARLIDADPDRSR